MDAFGGRPVWLLSLSLKERGALLPARDYTRQHRRRAEALACRVLDGAGDDEHERVFRMCLTFCLHRALSPEEIRQMPGAALCGGGGLAGGPVEVIRSKGVPSTHIAGDPCHRPGQDPLPGLEHLRVYLPIDCGMCPPCKARRAIHAGIVGGAKP